MKTIRSEIFKAGGTLHLSSPSYVKRAADDELFKQLLAGQFCYVLTSRQWGKSSLMIRTADRLRQAGARTAIVDLSGLGIQVTAEQWYLGMVKRIASQLQLMFDAEQWWHEKGGLGPIQCFTDFLHDVALAECPDRIVIFLDEIDSTLKLPFTDDFFAAIRVMYNLRASHPEYDRLTFVLLGVATPTDLIKDRNRTPFNIGYAVDLQPLSRADAQPLKAGMDQIYPNYGERILDRIFFWTNGHPYLTQRLCLDVAESGSEATPEQQVDALVERRFLAPEARIEDNLQFVRSNIVVSTERRRLLQLYRRVYTGQTVTDDERSPLQNRLRLIGLIRGDQGKLRVSNEIYRRVFDLAWIKQNTPVNWSRIVTISAGVIAMIAMVLAVVIVQRQTATTITRIEEDFLDATNVDVRISYLADLCALNKTRAQRFFRAQDTRQQMALFNNVNAQAADQDLKRVVQCLAPTLVEGSTAAVDSQALATAICNALGRLDPANADQLRKSLGLPCQSASGR